MWLIIIGSLLCVYYTVLMGYYFFHWKKCKTPNLPADEKNHFSIIIPVRNEAEHIISCLESLSQLNYDAEKYEVIVANDHSTDHTIQLVEEFLSTQPRFSLRVISLPQGDFGKKTAICKAVEAARNEIIICSDGDCIVPQNWLKVYDGMYRNEQLKMITGPVAYFPGTHFATKIQALEFCGLVAIGGASIAAGNPTTSNGANISYRKTVFNEMNGYEGNKKYASGDDDFLLHKIFATYPKGIAFAKHRDALVLTHSHLTGSSFVRQRIRWVSKSAAYPSHKVTLTLSLAYLYNLFLVIAGIGSFFSTSFFILFLVSILLKLCIEFIFYRSVLDFFSYKKLLSYLVPAQPFHILYVVVIGILGNIAGYKWKERNAKEYAAFS